MVSLCCRQRRPPNWAPNDGSLADSLLLWLRTPDTNFDPGTGTWLDSSGRDHHAQAAGTSEGGVDYSSGTLGLGENASIFAQGFSTVNFAADADEIMVSQAINEGQGLDNITIITVYGANVLTGAQASSIRPVGFGSWKLGNIADNFNLGIDPSIRKDNGNIGAGGHSITHPTDGSFVIRAAQLSADSAVSEWFNVSGNLEKSLSDAGVAYATQTDDFHLGDLRLDSSDAATTADIQVAEVIVYNRVLSDVEIEGVAEMVASKYRDRSGCGGNLAADGLLGYWSFDEASGTEAADASGNNRSASVRNGSPEWTEGRIGSALQFDGDDDLVVTGWKGLSGNAPRTIAYWVKTDWAVDASSGIVGWGASTTGAKWHTRLNNTAGNGVVGAIRTEIEGSYIIGTKVVNDNEWHHIVSVFPEGGTLMGDVKHYVDGELQVVSGMGSATVEVNTADEATGTDVTFGSRLQEPLTSSSLERSTTLESGTVP